MFSIKILVLIVSLLSVLAVGFIWGARTASDSIQRTTLYRPVANDESTLLALVSQYRVNKNLPPVKLSNTLCDFATVRVNHIVDANDWSHNGFLALSEDDPYHSDFRYLGEVLARKFDSDSEILDAWIQSPTHKEILDTPQYTYACVKMRNQITVMNFAS